MAANNSSTNCGSGDVHSIAELTELALYLLMLCVGTPINVKSLSTIFSSWRSAMRQRRYHEARFFFLKLNLNVTHLLVLLLYALSYALWLSTIKWLAPEWLCKGISFLWAFSFYSMSNVVVCVAIDRAFTVSNLSDTGNGEVTYRRTQRMILTGWLAAGLASVPQWYVWVLVTVRFTGCPTWLQCTTIWLQWRHELDNDANGSRYLSETLYELFHLAMLFWFPVLMMLVCDCVITVRMRQIAKNLDTEVLMRQRAISFGENYCAPPTETSSVLISGINSYSVCTEAQQNTANQNDGFADSGRLKCAQARSARWHRTQRKTEHQFCVIIFTYVICFFPYSLLGLWSVVHWDSLRAVGGEHFQFLKGLIVANAVVNPFLYKFDIVCKRTKS